MSKISEGHQKQQTKIPQDEQDTTPSGDAKNGVGEDNRDAKSHGEHEKDKKD